MILQLTNIHKSFGDVEVLTGVDLTVRGGEVVALVGENGAGKSTLTRIISGAHSPDRGTISIDGAPVDLKVPQDAMNQGIQVIYQEFLHNIFPHLSVAENLFTLDDTSEFGRFFVNKRRMLDRARELMQRIGLTIDPTAPAESLSVAELQMLEIAKSMGHSSRMLILDEPTAALDERESERLFEQIETLRSAGLCIIYISHRLEEVFRICDRVVVLRNGAVTLEGPTAALSERDVVTAMVGKTIDDFYPKARHASEEVVLSVVDAASPGHFGGVSLTVRAGEVLGIGGVLGCGKGSVLRALFGLLPLSEGSVTIGARKVVLSTPRRAIAEGVAYVTPDRQGEGLCMQQSVTANIALAALDRFSPTGFVDGRSERAGTAGLIDNLQIRTASAEAEVGKLSGGNQQKVLFGRWILTSPRVLLMEEPTRGVDVGAKAEIYRIINEQAAAGVAIILVSSDLPELVAMSDRVAVMRQGRIATELSGADLTQQKVLEFALESAA
ncbi:hypothetical protein GY21_01840 [Cryobacterium roopkundense]|uniref:ABC-type sugar transport system ATPase subunit n=1 Tax=Cryobacterium roopkundense TaxID=1001240 RepID=A0A099JSK7_9MICO|nr:sugar ABC transporter ATP-binding protein [Cryobacterium roopkundense]KGJ81126.1 hypothetical protein GY21_01840 [Cryobacterium roopkundense]MBB5641874.1 ABC-type sugar transport system ATPase subunit [Cryobacterium roopkundense]